MPRDREAFADALADAMRGHPYDLALDRARRLVNERRFALGVQLIDRRSDPLDVAAGYARVAEGALNALAAAATREFEAAHGGFDDGELIVLGLGRLGGCALTQASDLDIIYLHTRRAGTASNGRKPLGPNDYFNRLASRVTAALSVPTAAGPLYDVDIRLRPEGAKGMLVVSLDAFDHYQREEAWTWEHMALCRARPVFGSDAARERDGGYHRRDPALAARSAPMSPATPRRCAPKWSGTSRRKARSTSSSGRAGWSTSSSPFMCLQLTSHVGLDPRLDIALEALATESLVSAKVITHKNC